MEKINFRKSFLTFIIFLLTSLCVITGFSFANASVFAETQNITPVESVYSASKISSSTLDMYQPACKIYYDNLIDQYNNGNGDAKLVYSIAIYQGMENNIENLLLGNKVDISQYFNGRSTSFVNEPQNTVIAPYFQHAYDAFTMDYALLGNVLSPNLYWSSDGKVYLTGAFVKENTVPVFSSGTEAINGLNYLTEIAESFNFQNKTDYQKILIAHDFLANTIEYDNSTSKKLIHTAYGALTNNIAVCDGYSKSFKYIMDCWDIPCVLITGLGGTKNNPGPHMWNFVYLQDVDKWYALDVTWDDQEGTTPEYDYFLIDFASFTNNGTNVHTPYERIPHSNGVESLIYTLPTPSATDYPYPETPKNYTNYTVTVTSPVGNVQSTFVNGIKSVKRGNYVDFSISYNTSVYFINALGIVSNGAQLIQLSSNAYRLIVTDSDVTITVNLESFVHTITKSETSEYTITLSTTEATEGVIINVTINTTDPSKTVRYILVKGATSSTDYQYTTVTKYQQYSFKMPNENITVSAVIGTLHTITAGNITNGTATLTFSQTTAVEGERIVITASGITEGMRVKQLSATGVSSFTKIETNKFFFYMPDSAVVIDTELQIIPPSIKTSDIKITHIQGGSTLSFSKTSAEVGEEIILTVSNTSFGLKVKSITCNGTALVQADTENSFKLTIPSEDVELVVEYEYLYGFDLMIIIYAVGGLVAFIILCSIIKAIVKRRR